MVGMLDEGAKRDGAKPDGSVGIDPGSSQPPEQERQPDLTEHDSSAKALHTDGSSISSF
jgi:hypothetical protein